MAKWTFEPGHSAAEFRARHMMVTWVRGHFKNVKGSMKFEPDDPSHSSVNVVIDAKQATTRLPAIGRSMASRDRWCSMLITLASGRRRTVKMVWTLGQSPA